MKKSIVTTLLLIFAVTGCAALQRPLPQDDPTPYKTPSPTPTPIPPITINGHDVFNTDMIGQEWLFVNGSGHYCTFRVEAPAALHRNNPDGTSIDITFTDPNQQVAGRSGHIIVLHMFKTDNDCYWGLNIPGAEIWFVLLFNPDGPNGSDGSSRSIASIMYLPHGCGWCGAGGLPSTAPLIVTSDVLDNQPGLPLPYMISPPTTSTGQTWTFDTRVNATWNTGTLTFDNLIPPGSPLTGPTDGEFFGTHFYLGTASTPAYSGPVIVSDQRENICGHELWKWGPIGIVEIVMPYDGGQIPNDPRCVSGINGPLTTIKRVR